MQAMKCILAATIAVKLAGIQGYAKNYGNMTDEKANELANRI